MTSTLAVVPDISNKGLIETCDVTTGVTNEEAAKERRELVEDLRIAIQNAKLHKIEAGRLLTVLRDGTPYGQWEPLLEVLCRDVKISRATAHRYMELFAETQFLPAAIVKACQQHEVDLSKQPVLAAVKQAVAAQPEASPEAIVTQIKQAASQRQVDATKPIVSGCPDCGESFPSKIQLRKHGLRVHNIPKTGIAAFLKRADRDKSHSLVSVEPESPEPARTPRKQSATLRIVSAPIKEYYKSPLGQTHPHGRECGGLRGQWVVYHATNADGDDLGWLLLQQYKAGQRIIRLVSKDWNIEIGQALLNHTLKHHTNVYAQLDDLDGPEYLALYSGLMHEVSREQISVPDILGDLFAALDWADENSCVEYLRNHPDAHQFLIQNSEELGIRMQSGGDYYSQEITKEKLADVVLAGHHLWGLRPKTKMWYEAVSIPSPTEQPIIDAEFVDAPKPIKNPELVAKIQAHENATVNLKMLLKKNGIDADVSRSKSDGKFHVIWHDVTAEQVHEFVETFKA